MGLRDLTWFDVLCRSGELWPERTSLVFGEARITHAQSLARAGRLAAGLAASGLARGDRIAVLAHNRPEILDLLGAAAALGAILLPVNWRLDPAEIAAVLEDTTPRIVIADAACMPLLGTARQSVRDAAWYALDDVADGWKPYATLLADTPLVVQDDAISSDDALLIIPTAAVDGRAKGAVLSHANLVGHNLQLALAWSLGPADVALGFLPLFHISGIGLATATAQTGGTTILTSRFDAAAAAEAIEAEGVSVMFEFAPILAQILDAASGSGASLAGLRAVWGLDSPETIARFEATCPDATFWTGYGQSETSGLVTFAPHRERPGSAGRPTPLARFAILDADDRPATPGTVGEIAMRGPLVFQGYWNLPEETAWTSRGGWHHTGDMGRFDEAGYLVYAGRSPAKELIKTGGENVYPAEVERTLRAHEAVAEAVVFGVPDARWGEAVVAVCETTPDASADAETLIAFVGERIARYKRPKSVIFVESLPRLESGQPDRARIKAEHGG